MVEEQPMYRRVPGVTMSQHAKWDLQLSQGLLAQQRLAEIFAYGKFEKHELKTEAHQWEQTGNLCIEYRSGDKKSGIAVTEADYWVHELRRDNDTLGYFMMPMDRMKQIAMAAYRAGRHREAAGDGGKFKVILVPIRSLLR